MARLTRPGVPSFNPSHPLARNVDGVYVPQRNPLGTEGQTITVPTQCSYQPGPNGLAVRTAANGSFNAFGPTFGGNAPRMNSAVASRGYTLGVVFKLNALLSSGSTGYFSSYGSGNGVGLTAINSLTTVASIRVSSGARLTGVGLLVVGVWYCMLWQTWNTVAPYRAWIDGVIETEVAGTNFSYNNSAVSVAIGSGSGLGQILCDVLLWVNFGRYLAPDECRQWSENPWQIFRPVRRIFAVATATFNPAWATAANSVVSSGARAA